MLAALGVAALPLACAPRGASRPNVVMIVVDTLRADRLGVYGNQRGLTPFLDKLAWQGTTFTNAYASSTWTIPSIASLFTSRYPSQHQVREFGSVLSSDEVTLAGRLAAAGYATAGFTANPQLTAEHGYGSGFEFWQSFPSFKLPGPELRQACVAWLDRTWSATTGRPVFLFLQFMEPHAPYEPPAAFRARLAVPEGTSPEAANDKLVKLLWHELSEEELALLAALYDAEVAAVDAEIRALFDQLATRGVLTDAVVIVTADHGEELYEHRQMLHGITLYNQALRVPLVMRVPGRPAGTVAANVSLLDVAPTVLALIGRPGEPRFEGQSLVPLLDGQGDPRERDVIAELLLDRSEGPDWRQHTAAIVRGSLKLVLPPEILADRVPPALYDLAQDPDEMVPNPPHLAVTADALQATLQERLAVLAGQATSPGAPEPIDPEQRERLRALGYVR